MKRYKVRLAQPILQDFDLPDTKFLHSFLGNKAVIGQYPHAERLSQSGHGTPDTPKPDNQERFLIDFSGVAAFPAVPAVCSDTAVIDPKTPAESQKEHHRVLRYGKISGIRHIQHLNLMRRGLIHINVIQPHPVLANHL